MDWIGRPIFDLNICATGPEAGKCRLIVIFIRCMPVDTISPPHFRRLATTIDIISRTRYQMVCILPPMAVFR